MVLSKIKTLTMTTIFIVTSTILGGCGDNKQQAQSPKAQVKAMQIIQRDTPLSSEYPSHLVSTEEVKVQSKISGNVVEKYVIGGQFVEQGQLLYRIDSRQYESEVLQAQANAAQSEIQLKDAQLDLQRYESLLKDGAMPEQQVTSHAAKVHTYEKALAASEARVKLAMENLADTNIYAPISGQLGVDDVAIGIFVAAGQTTLVTLGSPDPIFAQFSISESEYLNFMDVQNMQAEINPISVTLTLTDGNEYPMNGQIVEVDRQLANSTGALIMKAIFPNPNGLLMPGMFARVKLTGEVIPNAILVPQRAIQQLLGKSFVMVVGKDNKSEARTVELGQQVGSYFVVKSGLTTNDTVIVEGLTSLREGVDLEVTKVTPGEMGFTLSNVTSTYNEDERLNKSNANQNDPNNLRGK